MSSLIPYAVMVLGIIILASHGMTSRMILYYAAPPSTVHMRAVVTLMILASQPVEEVCSLSAAVQAAWR